MRTTKFRFGSAPTFSSRSACCGPKQPCRNTRSRRGCGLPLIGRRSRGQEADRPTRSGGRPAAAADRRPSPSTPVGSTSPASRRRCSKAAAGHPSCCSTDTVGSPIVRRGDLRLSSIRYRVIAPDLPGLGRSKARGGPPAPADTTQWLSPADRRHVQDATGPRRRLGRSQHRRPLRTAQHHPAVTPPARPGQPDGSGRSGSASRCGWRWSASAGTPAASRRAGRPAPAVRRPTRCGPASASRYTAIEDYLIERARQPGVRFANRARRCRRRRPSCASFPCRWR